MFKEDRASVREDENALHMDGGEGRTATCKDLMPQNWALKSG